MDCDDGVFISNDLDLFDEELPRVDVSDTCDITTHTFQNPNINLAKMKVDLTKHLITIPQTEYQKGCIYLSIKVAIHYDHRKYSDMSIIPRLSRRQKAYSEYLNKIRPSFQIFKNKVCNESNSISFSSNIINTIPQYLESVMNQLGDYHCKSVQQSVNQFKLSLTYGYPIVTGIDLSNTKQAIVIVGFDNQSFIIRRFVDECGNVEQYMYLPYNQVMDNVFDSFVIYSLTGCGREVNLGFL